jgi:hypothetical protein
MVEPIGGRPGAGEAGPWEPGSPPDTGFPPGGGNGLESTLSVGTGVKVCALGGGGSGSTVCRPPPKLENRPGESQAVNARARTEATASLSENPVFIDRCFRIHRTYCPARLAAYQARHIRNKPRLGFPLHP